VVRTLRARTQRREKTMDDLVPVLVPKARVLDVYEFLSRPVEPREDGSHLSEEVSGGSVRGLVPWPPEMLERAYRESSAAMKRFFDHLADNPGRAVPIGELGDAVGYSPHQLAGTLGAAGRRITNRYKLRWPFAWERRPEDGIYYYTMNDQDAAIIRSVRAAM
jgi:hypothetical protein